LQLYDILRNNILKGDWKPGDMIPTEPELIELYGVSRSTVRQVLERFVNEGLIYRQQGKGSFVAEPTLEQGLTRIVSFTEDMRQRGLEPGTRILFSGLLPAQDDIAAALQIQTGQEVALLQRLRLANNEPMSIEESFLVHRLCPGVLEHDFDKLSLRETLEIFYGIRIERARQVIRAVAASKKIAVQLGVHSRTSLLLIERISINQDNLPIEFLKTYYRGDRYSLYNDLKV
jgi:GntR family transcriptional regulator